MLRFVIHKSVNAVLPEYKEESEHSVDLSRDYVRTVRMFRRRKQKTHLNDLLKLQHMLYFARTMGELHESRQGVRLHTIIWKSGASLSIAIKIRP